MKKINYIEDMSSWLKDFEFFIPINPRFSETDMFGHVNNTSVFIYFEQARIEFLKRVGLFSNLDHKASTIPIVADLQCDYLKQLFFNDSLKLYVKVNHVGNSSFDLHYLGKNQQEDICITGRGRMVQVNPATGKPVAFNEEIKTKLASN